MLHKLMHEVQKYRSCTKPLLARSKVWMRILSYLSWVSASSSPGRIFLAQDLNLWHKFLHFVAKTEFVHKDMSWAELHDLSAEWPEVFRDGGISGTMLAEAAFWAMLFSCSHSGTSSVWPVGMEHSLPIQRFRLENQHATTSCLPHRVPGKRPFQGRPPIT